MDKKPRILLSLCETAGYFTNLERGFRELGYTADTAFVREHFFAYKEQKCISFVHRLLLLNSKILFSNKPILLRVVSFALYRFLLLPIFLIQCLFKYDVFIFGFRKTFLPGLLDLPILKFFKKKVIFVFHGSDSRPAYLNGALNRFSIKKRYRYALKTKRELDVVSKYADHIIEAPATTIFFNRPVINSILIGSPQRRKDLNFKENGSNNVTILHSPSNIEAKGTPLIREAINELKSEGYELEYIEMIGQTNQQVLDTICRSDFVIDQMYSDLPLAVFTTEAAYYGKPAIVGGYEIDKVNAMLPKESRPPSFVIFPSKEELKKAVVKLVEDKDFRKELGDKAKDFVHNNWNATQVAKRFMKVINNDIPEGWYIDPYKMDFIYGAGIDSEKRKNLVQEYINRYGEDSLYLSDKDYLKKKLKANISN